MLKLLFFTILCGAVRADQELLEEQDENGNCILPVAVATEWNTFWPLVFSNGSLLETVKISEGSVVEVKHGENVILSCDPSYLKNFNKHYITAKCENGKFITENNIQSRPLANYFGCELRSIEEIVSEPVNGCPADLVSVKFGFVHPIERRAYVTGEACYSKKDGQTLFIHVRSAKTGVVDSVLEIVEDRRYFNKRHPDSKYKIDFLKAFRLDELNSRLREQLDRKDIPSFEMEKFLTGELFFNLQMHPTTKLGFNFFVLHEEIENFGKLKKDIQQLLDKTISPAIDIYVGSHGVTKVRDSDGQKVPIYLSDRRFPVPELVWIVVKIASQATAFVVFNDPLLRDEEIDEKSFCLSQCDQITWLQNLNDGGSYFDKTKGFVLCCDYQDFRNTVTEAPELRGLKNNTL